MIWMALSVVNNDCDASFLGLSLKTVYWYSMLNMSPFFLLFVYRLTNRKIDPLFILSVTVNELTLFSRYLFPMDYSDPAFWRLSDPLIAPVMSFLFSVAAIVGLVLLIREFLTMRDPKKRNQLKYISIGIGTALPVSVISEYILPVVFKIDTHLTLMYVAMLIFVVFTFVSITKHRFLNLRLEYFYKRLFLNALDGIVVVDRNNKILYINEIAKEILIDDNDEFRDRITDYIKEYSYDANYKQHEVAITVHGREEYLNITQFPIDADTKHPAKLLTITNITSTKLKLKQEIDSLIEKSSIDPLTGLFARQHFNETHPDNQIEPPDANLVITFIDVDDFKSINDLYGHNVGDLILKSVAVCIRDGITGNAKAFRFGGDEFVLVFSNAPIEDVCRTTEEIRRCVNALDFSCFGEGLKISVSIGLASGFKTARELLGQADKAMYQSKANGKNRMTVYSERGEERVCAIASECG